MGGEFGTAEQFTLQSHGGQLCWVPNSSHNDGGAKYFHPNTDPDWWTKYVMIPNTHWVHRAVDAARQSAVDDANRNAAAYTDAKVKALQADLEKAVADAKESAIADTKQKMNRMAQEFQKQLPKQYQEVGNALLEAVKASFGSAT